jgi:hypothetical protein
MTNFRSNIVLNNLKIGLEKQHLLTDWERKFVADLYNKIQNRIIKPENLSHKQFNTLQEVVEDLK